MKQVDVLDGDQYLPTGPVKATSETRLKLIRAWWAVKHQQKRISQFGVEGDSALTQATKSKRSLMSQTLGIPQADLSVAYTQGVVALDTDQSRQPLPSEPLPAKDRTLLRRVPYHKT